MSRRGRRGTAALTLLLALPLMLVAVVAPQAVPSSAQTAVEDAPDEPSVARVTLAAIDPVVTSGGAVGWAVVIEHAGDVPWERVEVVTELHGSLGSRSALRAALAGGGVPGVLAREVVTSPASPVPPGGIVRVAGTLPLTGAALEGTDSAVHPLRIRVAVDGADVGRIDTAVVRVGADPSARLATTLVWPIDAPPARDADGDPSGVLDPLTVAGGRLDTLLAALGPVLGAVTAGVDEDAGDRPPALAALAPGIALSVPAHLLEDLRLRGAGVPTDAVEDLLDGPPPPAPEAVEPAALRAALMLARARTTTRTLPAGPVITPYGDADLARLLASGPAVQALAGRAVLEGARRPLPLAGRDPARVLLLPTPVVPAVLDLLPVRTTIVPYAAIESPELARDIALGEPVRTLRSPSGRPVTALVGDPYLTVALGASTRALPGDPVRAAHEVLVRSAMVHLEAPGREGRALVLLPPDGFDPDPRFAAELLARLAAAPWLAPNAADALAASAIGAPEPARLRDAAPEPLPSRLAAGLTTTERELALLVGALAPDATTGGDALDEADDGVPVGARTLTEASDELMRATSRAFAGDVDRATELLAGVRRGIDAAFGTMLLDVADVTLTDRDGTVPITVTRTDGLALRLRVEVTGPAALTWTEGRVKELVLAAGESRALEVPVRSGATGVFPVTVRVTDPSGERLLVAEVIGVRATAVAGPALALIAATVVVLVIIGSLRQRRRGLALRTVPDDTGDGTGDDTDPEEVAR